MTKLKMFMKSDGTIVLRDPDNLTVAESSYLKEVMYVFPNYGQDGEDLLSDEFFAVKT